MNVKTVEDLDKQIAELESKKNALLRSELQESIEGLKSSYENGLEKLSDDKKNEFKSLIKNVIKLLFGQDYAIKKKSTKNKSLIAIDEEVKNKIGGLLKDGKFHSKKEMSELCLAGGEFKQLDWKKYKEENLIDNGKNGKDIEFKLK